MTDVIEMIESLLEIKIMLSANNNCAHVLTTPFILRMFITLRPRTYSFGRW